jgi:hypothetical protein
MSGGIESMVADERITASQATLLLRSEVFDDDSMAEYQPEENNKPQALETQIGGSHYKKLKIQPIEYIMANDLGFCEGNIVKYISRYKDKGTPVEDLKKIKQYCDFLIAENEG